MNKGCNILFIGGGGFIGFNIIKYLASSHHNIFVYEPIFVNLDKFSELDSDVTIIRGTLTDTDTIESALNVYKINVLVHLVSSLIPGSSFVDFEKEFDSVIAPTSKLIKLCAEKKIKFVYFSSGGTIYGNCNLDKIGESTDLAPISYYGLSKQIMETNILFESRKKSLDYLIMRPSNPFGPGQSLNGAQGLIAVILGKVLKGEPIQIWGDGSSIRDYIFIKDLCVLFAKLIDFDVKNDIINIGSGVGYSVNEIIACVKNALNINITTKYTASRDADVFSVVLDVRKLQNYVGDVVLTPMEDAIREFYDYSVHEKYGKYE